MQVMIQFFKDISPIKLTAICLGIIAFIILFVFYLSKFSEKDMSVLYTNLDADDSSKIIQELESKKVAYQMLSDGTTIKVRSDQVTKVRVSLAQLGIPNKGSVVGYEIFDKEDSIGTTNFSQNIKMIRALEGEITRTISAFEQIDKARVHLVLPQREVFSKEKLEPRASIILKFKKNKTLSKSEIEGLSHLVVTAVPGLDLKNITIIDTKGSSLKLGSSAEENNFERSKNEEYRVAYEKRLAKAIEDLFEQSLGLGKVKVNVAVDMNFDRTVTNSELYDPDSAVIRSVQSTDERERTPIMGEDNLDLSVANNLPGNSGSEASNQNVATIEKSDQTTNYEISKTIKNHISEAGIIKKLSVGILVDGTYKLNPDTNKMDYVPRPKEELDKMINLAKVAIGFNDERDDKIEVVNMQFMNDFDLSPDMTDTKDWLREELPHLFQTLVIGIVVILVLVTVIRPITLKVFEFKKNGDFMPEIYSRFPNTPHLAENLRTETDFDFDEEAEMLKKEKYDKINSSSQKINDLIVSYPQETASVLRKWLNENG
jgi:flagellar M-ring protein FliF